MIFYLLSQLDFEPSTALIVILLVYEVRWDALDGHDRFPYAYDTGIIINIRGSTTISLCLLNGSEYRAGGKNIGLVYNDAFADRGMTLGFAQAALQWFCQRGLE